MVIMMASSRTRVLSLYKQMLQESKKFTGYNYRTYAIRRIQDAFRENMDVTDPEKITLLVQKAEENLLVLQRQASISQLYRDPPLVIENKAAPKF